MRWSAELSDEAQKQLTRFTRNVRDRIERAIDEFETKDDSQWSNIKALRGPKWKGRYRKRVGAYRIISGSPPTAASWRYRLSSSDPKTPIGKKA
jgi:mRNA-degrading endonuclease RelE of RelBE toxin-antitoxin system